MLDVDRIAVFYGDIQVIFDLSLHVGEGEIVTLIGSNGAGKTTTVNAISGVLRPRSGEIRYRGVSTAALAPHRLVAEGLVQVPEGRLLYPGLTVRENLKMGAYPRASRRRLRERMDWVFELFPRLRERQGQSVATMSGGEQQMVAIGRGLMSFPRLLILDEPSIGLAPLLVREVFGVIAEISRNQVAILLIEQNAVQALTLAHRGYVLEHGHLAHAGPAAELLGDEAIRSAYLGI
ncbi:MAG: ABC transporter ATP-binding protein [Candidatus Lambdaproteobacteria bacterium]|nr:ABC transporter ATP-binding protein [Candidatus Lambdaproteobacteria bacterium]